MTYIWGYNEGMKMKLLPILLFLITSVAECLKLSRVLVPPYKLFGEDAVLKCEFDLGRDRLYAVKWYKDNEEFFRYVPRFNPPISTHPVEGVRVEISKSNDQKVQLRSMTVRSTGVYRCEVSAEAPSFASFMGGGMMTVVYLPKEAPQITGNLREEYKYEVGDVLDLNCTSGKSFPPAYLEWYINDSPVEVQWSVSLHQVPLETTPPTMVTGVGSSYQNQNQNQYHLPYGQQQRHLSSSGPSTSSSSSTFHNLMVSSLRLQLRLRADHFGPKGTAKVRCVARISPLFWQNGDEKILGHQGRQKIPDERDDIPEESTSHEYDEVNHDEEEEQEEHDEMEELEHHHRHNSYREHQHNQHHHRRHNSNHNNARSSHHNNPSPLDEDEEEEFYGHLPAYQTEARVLVRAGCSKPKISNLLGYSCLILFLNFMGWGHPRMVL